jgi:type II secretory pathway predicted ATPase ExeA
MTAVCGQTRKIISTVVGTTAFCAWEVLKFSGRQALDVIPFKGTAVKVYEAGKFLFKLGTTAGTAVWIGKTVQSGQFKAGASAFNSILEPVFEPVGAYASAAADSAKTAAKEFVVQTTADIASAGVTGVVHFIARRIFSAVSSVFGTFKLFFDVFKSMDTPAQVIVGGYLLLRFAGPRLSKRVHTFCIGPDLPVLAKSGSRCQTPMGALVSKKISQIPWLKNHEEMKPILNKDVKELVEPFIAANKAIGEGGEGFFRNMLLLGPPGTGKTMLAKYIAQESGMNYIEIDGGTFAWLEQIEPGRALNALKDLLRYIEQSGRPVLVLIDEADGLLQRPDALAADPRFKIDPKAKQSEIQFRSALLAATGVSNKLALVLTTNHPEKMDRALLSRVQVKVKITPPDLDSRIEILTKYIDKYFKNSPERATCLSDESIQELAQKTEGMSGRDLLFLVDNFVVARSTSRTKILTSKMMGDMLELSLRSLREEYDFTTAPETAKPGPTPLPHSTSSS